MWRRCVVGMMVMGEKGRRRERAKDEKGLDGANAIARVALRLRPSTREKRKNPRRTHRASSRLRAPRTFARDHPPYFDGPHFEEPCVMSEKNSRRRPE